MPGQTRVDFDVAVVGAGLAGLVCGSVLAHAGRRVALIERDPALGGRAKIRPYRDFHLPVGWRSFGKKAIEEAASRVGAEIDFVPLHNPLFAFFNTKTDRYVPLPEQLPEGFAEVFEGLGIEAGHGEQIGKLFAAWTRIPPAEIACMKRERVSLRAFIEREAQDRPLSRILFGLLTCIGIGILDWEILSAGEILEKFFFPITTGEVAGFNARPTDASITEAFARVIRERGGSVFLDTEAVRIDEDGRRVRGLIVRDRIHETLWRLRAPSVVAAQPVWHLLRWLPKGLLPQETVETIQRQSRYQGPLAGVWFGLSRPVSDVATWIRVVLPEPETGVACYYGGGAVFQSNLCPGLAPDGKQLFGIESIVPDEWVGDWDRIDDAWKSLREIAQRLVAALGRAGAASAELAEVTEWEKPVLHRPSWGVSHYLNEPKLEIKSPLDGLYLAGDTVGSARMGFDSAAASALEAADRILSER